MTSEIEIFGDNSVAGLTLSTVFGATKSGKILSELLSVNLVLVTSLKILLIGVDWDLKLFM